MSSIENPEVEEAPVEQQTQNRKKFDPGFVRNLKILTAFLVGSIVVIGLVFWKTNDAINQSGQKSDAVSIPTATGQGSKTVDPTPADVARLDRVAAVASDKAKENGKTYIPVDMPLLAEPLVVAQGPGRGYQYETGAPSGQVRDSAQRKQGLERQLGAMLASLEPPPTETADPYKVEAAANAPASVVQAAPAAQATAKIWIEGLHIAAGSLEASIDTEKTDFVMAKIATGRAAGALLIGQAVVQGSGVRVVFNRMSLAGKSYAINAVALDAATSSNAMDAEIDRQLLVRYVLPIFSATAQAYFQAVARPGQTSVPGGLGQSVVVTPEATTRQAAASGIAAGIGQATQAMQPSGGPTAFMPSGTSIGILFIDPVPEAQK